ncbi:MAG: hypothetical protein LBV67_12150 [Streptococcaceae bacterium]|nr:hypothetical protein [Streptococcaceae bacterium]
MNGKSKKNVRRIKFIFKRVVKTRYRNKMIFLYFDILQLFLFSIYLLLFQLFLTFSDAMLTISKQMDGISINQLQNSKIDAMFSTLVSVLTISFAILIVALTIFILFYIHSTIRQFIVVFENKIRIKKSLNTRSLFISLEFLLEMFCPTPILIVISFLFTSLLSNKIISEITYAFPVEEYLNNNQNLFFSSFIVLAILILLLVFAFSRILRVVKGLD